MWFGDIPGLFCLLFRPLHDVVVVLCFLEHRHVLVFVVVLSYAMLSPSVVLVRFCTIIVLSLFAVTIRYRLLTASYMAVHICSGINTKR